MQINGREIGPGQSPYIIAEIGASHAGSLQRAMLLMGAAAGAGADAVKFQAYTPDTITLDCNKPDFIIKDGPWAGEKLHELYKRAHTPFEWFPEIFETAKRYGATVFASVFDKTSVDMLERLGCPAYKIASMEIVDIPLIKYAAATGKPLIISTGMASDAEIFDVACALGTLGNNLAFLHCVSGYPTDTAESKLEEISNLQIDYSIMPIGLSDHTKGWEIPVAATALGATIIEKHVRFWNADDPREGAYFDTKSEDDGFALNPDEFREMCKAVRSIWRAMQPSEAKSEESSRQLRRSLYVVEDMKAGDTFTEANVRSIRPCYGLPPKELPNVLGRQAAGDIERGTALAWGLIASSLPEDQARSA